MAAHRSTRVCLVTELLDEPFDEGMKVFSLNLARYLHRHADSLAISSSPIPPTNPPVVTVPFGRVMLSEELRSRLRTFRPDILLYVPKASLTIATFLRLVTLSRMAPQARLAVIGLQPRQARIWTRAFVPLLSSLHVFTQSREAASTMSALGFQTACVPPGIDISRFHPVDEVNKNSLRKKLGIPADRFTILHVGHLAASRNLDVLAQLASRRQTQVVVVASTSTCQNSELKKRLNAAGVIVVDQVVPRIEQFYQMSDAYVFPVLDPGGSIEMPLSVLEAMACGLPVLTTPFGDLQRFFPPGSGVIFWRSADELLRGLDEIRQEPTASAAARTAVEEFGWDRAFGKLLGILEGDAA
jgi:glycosyltransferase involved in cell wall biosynthesis